MTLERALKNMETFFIRRKKIPDNDIWNSCLLGIEALKAHKRRREDPKSNWSYLLPGETRT